MVFLRVLAGMAALVHIAGAGPATAGEAARPARTGPVIEEYGPVWEIPEAAFATPKDQTYRVVFDVSKTPEDDGALNPRLESAARFLNMHARAGVPLNRIHLALVVHGPAGKDLLGHEAYRKRFGKENPNLELLRALRKAGVAVILCGQTAAYRGFERGELAREVDLALSAMTAQVALQAEGYALIAF